jgi:uncharacterized protein
MRQIFPTGVFEDSKLRQMGAETDHFDLSGLRLSSGEGRHLDLLARIGTFALGAETYEVDPAAVPVRVDVSRTTGQGYALRLRFQAGLRGPCMRCLEPASSRFEVDAREISQPGAGEELDSPYVEQGVLDLGAWARDALALTLPRAILCRADCAGLCPVCGADLNAAGPDHEHPADPDPRWDRLSAIRFD